MDVTPDKRICNFTDLEVWRQSHDLFLQIVTELESAPQSMTVEILSKQIIRSTGSIGANIAEGFNRSQAKYLNSIAIAIGEANETENWLYKLRDLNYLGTESTNRSIKKIRDIQKMLGSLHRSISKTNKPKNPK